MYKKIDIYVNGKYEFSTNRYKSCKEAIKEIRATKHITIASIPDRYLTIYDYDKVKAVYA
jgi:hypothetical protein